TKFDSDGKSYPYNHPEQVTRRCSYFAQNLYGNLDKHARELQDIWLHRHVNVEMANLVRQSRGLADDEVEKLGILRKQKYARVWKIKFAGQSQEAREQYKNTPSQLAKNRGTYKRPRDVRVWLEPEALEHARKLDNRCSSSGVSLDDGASLVYDKTIDGDGNYEVTNVMLRWEPLNRAKTSHWAFKNHANWERFLAKDENNWLRVMDKNDAVSIMCQEPIRKLLINKFGTIGGASSYGGEGSDSGV
ncbi:hypothetical protein HDU80_003740, partial [Chytriomyces hyalinus]